jgi:hypothetical protein
MKDVWGIHRRAFGSVATLTRNPPKRRKMKRRRVEMSVATPFVGEIALRENEILIIK